MRVPTDLSTIWQNKSHSFALFFHAWIWSCTFGTIQLCSSNLTSFRLALIAFFYRSFSIWTVQSFSFLTCFDCSAFSNNWKDKLNKMNAKLVYILIYFSKLVFPFSIQTSITLMAQQKLQTGPTKVTIFFFWAKQKLRVCVNEPDLQIDF